MNNKATEKPKARRRRTIRNFPASTIEEPLQFTQQVFEFGSGQPVRRLSIFDHLNKSPESGPSRQLIANSNKYGLIKGNSASDMLEITPEGLEAISEESSKRSKTRARIQLGIQKIEPFQKLYERFKNNKLPAKAALIDAATEFDVEQEMAEEAVDTFIVNLRHLGLLQTLSGAERIVTVDHLLDQLPTKSDNDALMQRVAVPTNTAIITSDNAEYETTAFYVAPIGSEDSIERKHSDLFLSSLVEPALEQFRLNVVRADAISKPGTINKQILEYLLRSRLVVADLSYHNPNVFYELAIRHMIRKPVVQIMRSSDKVPFDVGQVRTIMIDTSDIYSLVPKIDTYRSEIATQVRSALDDPDSVDNPLSTHFPNLQINETISGE
ncbi:MAG: hypothetical protein ABJE63_13625 [Lentilitoribacter sp.]